MAMSGGAYAMKPWKLSIGDIVDVAFHQPIVSQRGKMFSPTEVTMPLGATIRIDNDDNIVHNLRIFSPDGEKHDYGIQKPGESTDIDLKQLGEYMARCNIHPIMKLVIHVK
jgi:plastocyanin